MSQNQNAPADPLQGFENAPETTQSEPSRCGHRIKMPSAYICNIVSSTGTTDGRSNALALPKGMPTPTGRNTAAFTKLVEISKKLQDQLDESLPGITSSFENAMSATMRQLGDPLNSVEEARWQSDWPQWRESLDKEMTHHLNARTWELVDLPKNANAVGSRVLMLYKHGPDGEVTVHKSRFVAQGFSQEEGIDYHETFSPTAKLTAI
jgi:hypothetical protein